MSAYLDTGVITKWYVAESNSPDATRLRRRFKPPCPLTPLHRLELRNAWRLKVFRREIDAHTVALAEADLEADIESGVWLLPDLDLATVFVTADQLAEAHTARIGFRSLDVLHVAAAVELASTAFITSDERQGKLATAAGLRVVRL